MKEGRARRSFRLKIQKMKEALSTGVIPDDMPEVCKVEDLVKWHDPPDRISWKSFSIAAPGGPNGDLRTDFNKILPAFVHLQTGRRIRGAMPPKKKPIREWLVENEMDSLLRQNADLIARLQVAEEQVAVSADLIVALQAEIAELTSKLSRIIPLKSLS